MFHPQPTGKSSTPTFAGLILSGLTASRIVATNASKALASVSNLASWVAGTANQITVTDDTDGTITLSGPQDLATASSPTFAGLTLSGLTASRLAVSTAGSALASDDLVNWVASAWADQIIITDDGAGGITVGTPQNINTTSSPTFASISTTSSALLNGPSLYGLTTLRTASTVFGYINVRNFPTSNVNLALSANSYRALVICDAAWYSRYFDVADNGHPQLWIFDENDPDVANNRGFGLYHDSTRGCLKAGAETNGAVTIDNNIAILAPWLETEYVRTITGGVTDGYSAALRLDPGYSAATAQTVTRHNYIDAQNVSVAGAGPAALTDGCLVRFDAAAGTHCAVASGTGNVDAWIKHNLNGALAYSPLYTTTSAPSATQTLAAGSAITVNSPHVRVAGDGGNVTLTSTPSIAAGPRDGYRLLIEGTADAATITIQDVASLAGTTFNGDGNADVTLGQGDVVEVVWNASDAQWYEVSRSNN